MNYFVGSTQGEGFPLPCFFTSFNLYGIINRNYQDVVCVPADLKSGHKKSCGCIAKFIKENLIGQKFDYLEVLDMIKEFRPNIGKNGKFVYFAICKCHLCGNENFKVITGSLKAGRTTSCGCRRDQYKSGEEHGQFTGYKEISGKKWTDYQKKAQSRNFVFELKIEDAWEIYEKQKRKCALSDIPIVFGNWKKLEKRNYCIVG